jgi:hypothetical protein
MGNDMTDQDPTTPIEQDDVTEARSNFVNLGGTDYDIEDYTLPADRTFREAWDTPTGAVIGVNMDKAKDIWRDKIRSVRPDEFEKLDAEFMKALETNNDTSSIVAQKQALRDAPQHPDIDAATTPEELKLVQIIPNVTV